MEGVSNLREVMDESLVEVHESYKGLDIFYLCWLQPICDSLGLDGVHHYMVFQNDKPKIIHLSMFELTFPQLRNSLYEQRVCERGREDENVVHVTDGFIVINEGVEDVIHHCLEGSR